MFDNLDEFKLEIEEYVRQIYSLILEDYIEYLPQEKIDMIKNFDYKNNIKIDNGGMYSTCLGRFENKTKTLALSPVSFYNNIYNKQINKDIELLDIDKIIKKMENSSEEIFNGLELANYIKQKNLTIFDITKGIVIHELFHSIITLKDENEIFNIEYNNKYYECRGIRGDYLEEGFVEYYARKFANKHKLFMFPSIPYQENINYAKNIANELGKNIDKLIFNCNYKTLLNYVHRSGEYKKYYSFEKEWLNKRIKNRLENKKNKEELLLEIEELKLI